MILKQELPLAKKNTKEYLKGAISAPKSLYNPSKEVKDRTAEILKKFYYAYEIHNKPYEEFNDKSLIEIINDNQKLFNNYRRQRSTDPDEMWKSNALRPIVRNRVISIAAHVTGALITPNIQAQNTNQEKDKDAAMVMRDLLEWAQDQANYAKTFLYAVIAAIVNPGTLIHTEYTEHYRTIKDILEDGKTEKKQVLDDILSGFRDSLVPLDELFIADIYEHDIQRQPFLIWRRVIHWNTAYTKYADNKNFLDYVRPGLQIMFDAGTDTFYEQYDENLSEHLVEEVIYYDRNEDLQIRLVNGVMMDDPEHPNPRKDKLYPFVKSGYELIDEGKFFYYFSLVRKMMDDAEIVNTLYRMVIDGTFLQLMPPTAVFGDEYINSSVVTPGTVTTFKEGTRLERIDVGSNIAAGFNALEKVEASISESSSDILQSGQSIQGQQTAFEISRLEANARIMLGLFGKMIGFMVKDLATLRVGDILQYMTVAEIDKIVGDDATLRYRSFLISDKLEDGKKKSHRIMLGEFPISEDETEAGFDMLAVQGGAPMERVRQLPQEEREKFVKKGVKGDSKLYIVNPSLFRELKYKVVITPDVTSPPSDNLKKALALELYDRAIQNPLVNQEAVLRDLLFASYEQTRSDTDKYIVEQQPQPQASLQQGGQGDVLNKLFGQGSTGALNRQVGQSQLNV